jgi:hypothetical protein
LISPTPVRAARLLAGDVIVKVGSREVGSIQDPRLALQTQQNIQLEVTLAIIGDRLEGDIGGLLFPAGAHQRQSVQNWNNSRLTLGRRATFAADQQARFPALGGGSRNCELQPEFLRDSVHLN